MQEWVPEVWEGWETRTPSRWDIFSEGKAGPAVGFWKHTDGLLLSPRQHTAHGAVPAYKGQSQKGPFSWSVVTEAQGQG